MFQTSFYRTFNQVDEPSVEYKHEFGYFVNVNDSTVHCDSKSIELLRVNKTYYTETLIKEFGAKNFCTVEFPSLFFATRKQAEKAVEGFYMPLYIAALLIQGENVA